MAHQGYTGFVPRDSRWRPDVVDAASISPEHFFSHYVSRRVPVILQLSPTDPEYNLKAWDAIPDCELFVEHRHARLGTFGTGVKSKMRLSALLEQFNRGRTDLYATTQPLPEDSDGRPTALYASPITEMVAHTPMRPRIAGNLVPSTINAWIGAAREGSSSNLHHDFHDNLYLLLRGRKRFTIAPPSCVGSLYPVGPVSRVHANGLVNYGANLTRGDGALAPHVVEFLERQLSESGKQRERGAIAAALRVARAASRELAAAAAAAAEAGSVDDFSSSLAAAVDDDESAGELDSGAAADDMWAALAPTAKPVQRGRQRRKPDGAAAAAVRCSSSMAPPHVVSAPTGPTPDHFSMIDLPGLRARARGRSAAATDDLCEFSASVQRSTEAATQWPLFASATLSTFDVEAGQMLFLPAGWWHEVVSFGGDSGSDGTAPSKAACPTDASCSPSMAGSKRRRGTQVAGAAVGRQATAAAAHAPAVPLVAVPARAHVALNWWFHPPTTTDFRQPYEDGFWEHVFATTVSRPSV